MLPFADTKLVLTRSKDSMQTGIAYEVSYLSSVLPSLLDSFLLKSLNNQV